MEELDLEPTNVGELISGRYLIAERLGEGGMGILFLANDSEMLNRSVVLKFPKKHVLHQEGFVGRFEKEIAGLVHFEHPHVVRVYGVGKHQRSPYMVLQYLAGGSLQDKISQHGALTPEEVMRWLPQLAEALDALHKQGIIHRDVKSANILFDRFDQIYLSDFGIIKVLADIEKISDQGYRTSGGALGSPESLAPEFNINMPLTPAYDQYGLATVVYQTMSGQLPFAFATLIDMQIAVIQQQPAPLSERAPNVSGAFSDVVMKALSKRPMDRYESCEAFTKALAATLKVPTSLTGGASVSDACHDDGRAPVRPPLPNPEVEDQPKKSFLRYLAYASVAAVAIFVAVGVLRNRPATSETDLVTATIPIATNRVTEIPAQISSEPTRAARDSVRLQPPRAEREASVPTKPKPSADTLALPKVSSLFLDFSPLDADAEAVVQWPGEIYHQYAPGMPVPIGIEISVAVGAVGYRPFVTTTRATKSEHHVAASLTKQSQASCRDIEQMVNFYETRGRDMPDWWSYYISDMLPPVEIAPGAFLDVATRTGEGDTTGNTTMEWDLYANAYPDRLATIGEQKEALASIAHHLSECFSVPATIVTSLDEISRVPKDSGPGMYALWNLDRPNGRSKWFIRLFPIRAKKGTIATLFAYPE